MDLFDLALGATAEDLEFGLGVDWVPWADYLLNPRRLRGSDFLMRWSQGVWSEGRIIDAVNRTGRFYALPYGPSGTAPENDVREFELYFERLEKAGLAGVKRPDLLIFPVGAKGAVEDAVESLGGEKELPFTSEDDPKMRFLLSKSIIAVECENSLWRVQQMPDFGVELSPQKRMGGHLRLKKTAVVPTVILKEEDRATLAAWQKKRGVAIHIWHVFYDLSFGIAFDNAETLIRDGLILPTDQVFQAPGGATTTKTIYKIYYHHAYRLGQLVKEPALVAASITDKNGHILPYVRFEGGILELRPEALKLLDEAIDR